MKKEAREYYDKKLEGFSDASERIFERVFPEDKATIKKIHLTGICGTAMGSVAILLKKAGYHISGSDTECYPPMSNVIEDLGIEFYEGFKASNITGKDVIIIGNVCGPDNPESKAARHKKIPTLSVSEAIEYFFIGTKKSIVVAGTHGKTTTTGLMAHVFLQAGLDPGYMVGGVGQGEEESARIGGGDHFIIEGDEYDTSYFDKSPKFLHYKPYFCIITSLEFDHIDIYKDMGAYTDAFTFLVQEVSPEGGLFLCGDHEEVRALAKGAHSEVFYYGLGQENDITARDILIKEEGQEFELVFKGESLGIFLLPLLGRHNLTNSLAVCGVALRSGMSPVILREALANFKGMKRRQEVVYDKEITIIDDFAHHPTAVSETISAIRSKYHDRRLVIFFEPRSNTSRRKVFEESYGTSFDEADLVFISTPKLKPLDDPADFIVPEHMVKMIHDRGTPAFSFPDSEDLLTEALKHIEAGDVVLIMSNGSFGGIHLKLAASMKV